MPRKIQRRSTGQCILVVDDQEEMLLSVQSLLEREGHRVLIAGSGARALELFKENEIQLLLVDYFMPRMNGGELVREIRQFDPFVQIILQTGYGGEKPASEMMRELDIQGYHDKSDGPEKLLLWVDVGLKAHRLITRLRERERLQSELIANMSHELRTPLHIIGGYTDLLLQSEFGDLPEEARRALSRVATATRNLSEMVSDLLRYGKLEAKIHEGTPRWMKMEDIAAELERLAALLLEDKPVRFSVDVGDAPAGVTTDPVKLTAILRNLVTNAVKFTEEGEIEVRVRRAGDRLRFSVRDTGIGIAPELRRVVFEPFRQADGSATREHSGIGLGLALSLKLARVLGGDSEMRSSVGSGSTFTLVLPCDEAEADVSRHEKAVRSVRTPELSRLAGAA